MVVQLKLYRVSSKEREVLIASLSYDVKRQIDDMQFSVNFCKPRLKLLDELYSHPKDTKFFWSDGQFGMVYRSVYRYSGFVPFAHRDYWIALKWLRDNNNTFCSLFPYQTKYVLK